MAAQPTHTPITTRRALLRSAALAGIGVPLLVACGSDDSDSGGAAAGTELATTSEVPEGGGLILGDDEVVITQPTPGEFKAFTAVCTHQGCTVASVEGGTINCDCHGSKFKIEDGSVANGPAASPLEEKPITVKGDTITLS